MQRCVSVCGEGGGCHICSRDSTRTRESKRARGWVSETAREGGERKSEKSKRTGRATEEGSKRVRGQESERAREWESERAKRREGERARGRESERAREPESVRTATTLQLHCTYTAPTLHLHCNYTATTLHPHCTYTARHTCQWVVSHMWTSHVTHVNKSCHKCQ